MEETLVSMEVINNFRDNLVTQLRYYSFNQWIKTFDNYQRVAKVRGIWTDPTKDPTLNFSCPAMLGQLPCKGAVADWRDLNNCAFAICENPPTFGKL